MSLHDHRTKPDSQWTYYVVDHLPSMANIYRFNTPEEAISCYRALDPNLHSAIGSSINGIHELDHIHRCANDLPVLVTDSDMMDTPLWRDSRESQHAIDQMISALGVQHEKNTRLFGAHAPAVIVPLERNIERPLDSYFRSSILYPDIPGQYQSAIKEVYAMGHGWMAPDAFRQMLLDSRPGQPGKRQKDIFVERLSVRYLDMETGYSGTADISVQQYGLFETRTRDLLSPEKLASDLDTLLSSPGIDLPGYMLKPQSQRIAGLQEHLSNSRLYDIRKSLAKIVSDPAVPSSLRESAGGLQHRLTALTPPEMRRVPLNAAIAAAFKANAQVHSSDHTAPRREEQR